MMAQNIQATVQSTMLGRVPPGASNNKIYSAVFQGYPDVLDVKHVSELLGVSSKTVYRLLNEGTLDSLKVGRAFKVPKLYLLQYIKVIEHAQQQG